MHPDKLRGVENASDGFEQVKTAYQKLMDPDQRRVIIMNVEYVRQEVLKERKKLITKGVRKLTCDSTKFTLIDEGKRIASVRRTN